MYASTVLNVSSFWPAGPHLNETLCPVTMPANTSAEILGCGYPQYHPFQITGRPSTNAYGDNTRAFCPATKTGTGGFATGGDQYLRFAFDASASYERDGYTEFIVVGFSTAVYVQTIEIGEVRGAGSIVRIKALRRETGEYMTLWESVDGEGDPRLQYRQQARLEYRVFKPYPICETTFKTDTIRLEMDTRSVTDWNELDYIAMVGSSKLRSGVLPAGTRELMYVPNSDAEGADRFGYAVSDCPFQLERFSFAPILVRVLPPRVRQDYCMSFYGVTDFATPRSEFSEADDLPKGAMTISFRFRIFSRRQPESLSNMGVRFQNRLSFAVVPNGDLYFDLGDASFNIPTSGGASFGWHHVAVSFDSATGVIKGYFDGRQRMTELSYKSGQRSIATFGPGGIESFVLNTYAFIERDASTNSLSGNDRPFVVTLSPLRFQGPKMPDVPSSFSQIGVFALQYLRRTSCNPESARSMTSPCGRVPWIRMRCFARTPTVSIRPAPA